MQQYKLKQSTLENKAGEIFTRQEVNGVDVLLPPSGDVARAIPFASMGSGKLEQFFDVVEVDLDKGFVPEIGKKYSFIENSGTIAQTVNGQEVVDADRFALGNAYRTKELAEQGVRFLKARAKIVSDPAGQYKPIWANAMQEVTKTVEVELENGETETQEQTSTEAATVAWYVGFNHQNDQLIALPVVGHFAPQAVAFYADEDDAKSAINRLGAAYKTYFGGL